MFRAVNIEDHRAAACKVVALSDETPDKDRKVIDKEMRVHTALKHRNVLEFLNAIIVETKYKHQYYPGYYMLLEFAAGGDLFDKIAPDVGVGEDVAKLYFSQLVDGMVSFLRWFNYDPLFRICPELYTRARRVSSRSEARKSSLRCGWNTQDI